MTGQRTNPGELRERMVQRLAANIYLVQWEASLAPWWSALATVPRHRYIAIRRRRSVTFTRADQLLRRLKAARLDNTVEAEMRRLARLDLLIIDNLALHALDHTQTADRYKLVIEDESSRRRQRPDRHNELAPTACPD